MRALLAAAVLLASPAAAQVQVMQPVQCGPFAELDKLLRFKFKETLVATGVVEAGKKYGALYVSPERTFTVITVDTAGTACMVTSGSVFSGIGELPKGDPM